MMLKLLFRCAVLAPAASLALLLHASPTRAEGAPEPVPTRFQDAVSAALSRRADLRLASADVDASAAKVDTARAAFWPRLDLSAEVVNRFNYDAFTGTVVDGTIDGHPLSATVTNQVPRYQAFSALTLNWNLYSGGESSARLENADASLRSAAAQRGDVARQVVIDVATAYCGLLKAQKELDAATIALEAESLRADTARQSMALGKVSLLAAQSSALELQRAHLRQTKARLAMESQWRAYLDAIGLRDAHQTIARVALTESEEALQGQLAQWTQTAQAPANHAAVEAWAAAQAQVRAEAGALRPKLDFVADYSYVGRDDRSVGSAVSNLSRRLFYVGIRLNWTLFDAKLAQSRVRVAAAEEAKAAIRVETHLRERDAHQAEQTLRVAELEDEQMMLQSQLELARLETEVAKTKLELQQLSPSQYRAQVLAGEETKILRETRQIDLALAKFVLAMQSSR